MAVPLVGIVCLSMAKDLFEDQKKAKQDSLENNKTVEVYDGAKKSFLSVKWQDVRTGSLIKLKRDQFTPCDVVVIYSPEDQNSLYVETKSLDGETNLKMRKAPDHLEQDSNLY